jgi:hypothetical protein
MPELNTRLSDAKPVEGELLFDDPADDRRTWLKLLSTWTDNVFEVPGLGWRFGLDPIIGLVPVVGDLASAAISLISCLSRLTCESHGTLMHGLNVGIDYFFG